MIISTSFTSSSLLSLLAKIKSSVVKGDLRPFEAIRGQ